MTRSGCFFLLLCICLGCAAPLPPADLIVHNGTIYTLNDAHPVVQAVVVRGDSIVYVGDLAGAEVFKGEKTEIIDLKGRTMTPGFIEGHGHLMGVGYNELNLDLMNVKSYDEMVQRVAEAVQKAKPGQWIVGRGWHQDKWDARPAEMIKGFPLHHALSAVSPDNPVFLRHASGHAGIANAKAMEIAGVNILSKEARPLHPNDGGEILRDALGNPTGLFNERAMTLITEHIPPDTDETDREALELAIEACLRNGITSFHDAGTTRENIALFREFKRDNMLHVRVYAMLTGYDRDLLYEWMKRGVEIDRDLTVRSIKLNCDGALGSRGAWLLEPYADRPGFYGMPTLSMDTVLKTARAALKHGFQVCSHAIGDRANREILDRYEIAFREYAHVKNHRFRIEHAQHIHPDDIQRFAKLGVVPAMQAIHMASDRPWAIDRLGEKRIREGAYMWQSLLKSGARIVNGTDAPVEPLSPIACFYAAITRQTLQGTPPGGYEPAEKMTRLQALRSYTLDAAYGAFEESVKGSIEPGKLADFTVLSKDIMTVAPAELLSTEIEMTIVGGKVMYRKR